jgi:hypothetical protein
MPCAEHSSSVPASTGAVPQRRAGAARVSAAEDQDDVVEQPDVHQVGGQHGGEEPARLRTGDVMQQRKHGIARAVEMAAEWLDQVLQERQIRQVIEVQEVVAHEEIPHDGE